MSSKESEEKEDKDNFYLHQCNRLAERLGRVVYNFRKESVLQWWKDHGETGIPTTENDFILIGYGYDKERIEIEKLLKTTRRWSYKDKEEKDV